MPKVLFVCTGNVCRSSFAERLARLLSDGSVEYASAGIQALHGEPMDRPMADQLSARGGTSEGFAGRQLTAAMVREADLLLCMESRHRLWVVDEAPVALRRTTLLTHFTAVAAEQPALRGDQIVKAALAQPIPRGVKDIADPYRQGDEAAALAAEVLAQHVRQVVIALEG
ncbi:protein-tyrosine-phosphatase [Yimella radicis]